MAEKFLAVIEKIDAKTAPLVVLTTEAGDTEIPLTSRQHLRIDNAHKTTARKKRVKLRSTDLFYKLRDLKFPPVPGFLSDGQSEKMTLIDSRMNHSAMSEQNFDTLLKKQDFYWVDIEAPSTTRVDRLIADYGLHPSAFQGALNTFFNKVLAGSAAVLTGLERAQRYPRYWSFVLLELVGNEEVELEAIAIDRAIITVHAKPIHSVPGVIEALKRTGEPITHGVTVAYALLRYLSRNLLLSVANLEPEVKSVEMSVLEFDANQKEKAQRKTNAEFLQRHRALRSRMSALGTRLAAKREVVRSIRLTRRREGFPSDLHMLLFELHVALERALRVLEIAQVSFASVAGLYLGRLSLQISLTSQNTSKIQQKFTAVSTLFFPLMLIQGYWAMNVKVPGQCDAQCGLKWFWGLMSFSAAFLVLTLVFIKYKKWW